MRKLGTSAVVMAAMLTVAMAASAQRVYREGNSWVEETSGTLPATHNLRVDTAVGSVQVAGGAASGTYSVKKRAFTSSEETARREFESLRVATTQQGDMAVLRAEFVRGGNHRVSAEFRVQVPRDMQLVKIDTRGGSIGVQNIAGRVESETAGGSISVDQIGGPVVANTMGGNIVVGDVAGEITLKSAGGGINVRTAGARLMATTYGGSLDVGDVKQAAILETMGGSIRVRQTGGELRASTAGGNIDAGEVGGSAVLKTAGGNIRLISARGPVEAQTAGGAISLKGLQKGVRAETAAGGIVAELLGRPTADSTLETTAGDITVFLASNIACSVRAAIEMASGHKIRSDFPELKISSEGSDYGPKEWYAQGALNGGGPVLKVRTSIGDIEFRRAAAR